MLPPLGDIMAGVHSPSRRRFCVGKSIYVVSRLLLQFCHIHQHLLPPIIFASLVLPWFMYRLRGLLMGFIAWSVHYLFGCVQVSGPSSPS